MCGITGIYAFNTAGNLHMINLSAATDIMEKRGPDFRGVEIMDHVGLGHRRLSIIDTSDNARQPMKDASGRYTIVYNGEIYNFGIFREQLAEMGVSFKSTSDTEVLLYFYMHLKENSLTQLNGFFSFAVYDSEEDSLFLARDRFGIKPLYYYKDEDKFIFASDMRSIIAYGLKKEIDYESLYTYLQLNYIPAPHTMLKDVKILMPGYWMKLDKNGIETKPFYEMKYFHDEVQHFDKSYEQQQIIIRNLLEESVKMRLISDVPLGTFLSGGIDSTIISGLARKHVSELHTFSIGYADEPFFDETNYANLVAKKFDTKHTVFSLTNDDLYDELFNILDYFDQPFADSSAIPTYILSKKTRKHITVALSGDGADELFSGYNKHSALLKAMQSSTFNHLMGVASPVFNLLPKSRNNPLTNKIRQASKYAKGIGLSQSERYWQWAGLISENKALGLLNAASRSHLSTADFLERKNKLLAPIKTQKDFNELLLADMQLVLPNDMLTKVDIMSMANALEVRVPFLDHHLVDYVLQLPSDSKINGSMRKRILQDAFRDLLPPELYNRPKHGFEVPLLKWFRTSLKSLIKDDLLSDKLIEEQNIFDPKAIRRLRGKLFSINPGDSHATVWALMVFQWWWKKYLK